MIGQRLKDFIVHKNISIREFERICDIGHGVIAQSIRNNGAIGSDKLEIILNKYPELNIKWLLTGEGEMLLVEKENNEHYLSLIDSKLSVSLESQFILPFLGDASAGYIVENYEHEIYLESFSQPLQRGQNIRGFVVQGDSMYPILNNGDIVFCKRLSDFNIHKFLFKDVYVIICNLGICIKHVIQNINSLRLVSDNSQYKDIEVPETDVYEVWRVEGKYIRY